MIRNISKSKTIIFNFILFIFLFGILSTRLVSAKAVRQESKSQSEEEDPEKRKYFCFNGEERMELKVKPDEFAVQFKQKVTKVQIDELNSKYGIKIIRKVGRGKKTAPIYILSVPKGKRLKDVLKLYSKKKKEKEKVRNVYGYEPIVEWAMPSFYRLSGAAMIPTDEFSVMLKPGVKKEVLLKFNKQHGVKIIRNDALDPYWHRYYHMRVTSESDLNSLDMANLYHDQPFTEWAVPNYLDASYKLHAIPNDDRFDEQWNLHQESDVDIDAPEVWDIANDASNSFTASAVKQKSNSQEDKIDPEKRQYFWYDGSGEKVYFEVKTDEFVVQFKEGVTQSQIDQLNSKYGITIIKKVGRGRKTAPVYILSMPTGRRLRDVLKLYPQKKKEIRNVYGYELIVAWTMPSFYNREHRFRKVPTDEFNFVLKPSFAKDVLLEFNRQHGVEIIRNEALDPYYYHVRVTSESDLNSLDMANLYHQQPFTEWAAPNYLGGFELYAVPKDARFSEQWNLHNQESDIDIDAPEAWDIAKGDGIIIAVIDTGIDLNHEDLSNKLTTQYYDFWDEDSLPEDTNGHGTAVAGIAAAVTDNNSGIAGVGWNSDIMPLRVSADGSFGDPDKIKRAFYWAVEKGAKVINCSWGGPEDNPTLKVGVKHASDNNRIVICAAGNDGTAELTYPADYDFPGVMKVGAVIQNGDRWGGSNLYPDVVAPTDVLSTRLNGGYSIFGMTSAAAPHVSGLAALLLSYKDLTPAQVKEIIEKTADTMGNPDAEGYDIEYGHGRINAFRALQYLGGTIPSGQVREWKYEHVYPQEFDILIAGDVTVPFGTTLKIKPGTMIRFEQKDFQSGGMDNTRPELLVSGNLIANGEADGRIKFESATGGGQPWYGIHYTGTGSNGISFCEIRDATIGIEFYEFESPFTVSDCTIEQNWIGIGCYYSDHIRIVNNTIRDAGHGVTVFEGGDIQIGDVGVGNTIENSMFCGVSVYNASYTNVFSNEIRNNNYFGVLVNDSLYQVYIGDYQYPGGYHDFTRGNNIHHNGLDGIRLSNSATTVVEANNIYDTDSYGIYSYISSPDVNHNTITNNNYKGFVAYWSGMPVLAHNKISNNAGRGIYCYRAYPAMDYGYNEISGHTYNMYVENVPGDEILARRNNWGLPVNQVDAHIWDDDETGGQEPEVIFRPIYYGSPWAPPLPALTQKQERKKSYVWALMQNYPNPFNPETWLPYSLKEAVPVTLEIYNARGQLVRVLKFGVQEPGDYLTPATAARWDGRNHHGEQVASGLYFYRFKAGDFRALKRMVLLK